MTRPILVVRAGSLDYWHVGRPLHPGLRTFVHVFEGCFGTMPSAFQIRGAPIVHTALVISLGDPFASFGRHGPADAGVGSIGSLVRGPDDRACQIAHGAASEMILVRLSPVGAYRLFAMPMSELRNTVVPFEDVWGPSARVLEDRLASVPDWEGRFDLLEAELLARIDRGPECAPEVAHGWRLLSASGGTIPVSCLAAEVGWSHQHLTRRFTQQIGTAPKRLARVLRLRRAITMITAGGRGLSEIAAACGYADQAHMTREFRDLMDTRPTRAVSEVPESEKVQVRPRDWQGGGPSEDPFY